MNINKFLKAQYVGKDKKLCKNCNTYKSWPTEFPSKGNNKKGEKIYRHMCKPCWRPFERTKERKKIEKCRDFMVDFLLQNPCVDCGNSDIRVLEFDHIKEKNTDVSILLSNGKLKRLQEEIKLCEVVCANCHRIRTMRRGNFYRHRYYKDTQQSLSSVG
jgi:hypothetical protein